MLFTLLLERVERWTVFGGFEGGGGEGDVKHRSCNFYETTAFISRSRDAAGNVLKRLSPGDGDRSTLGEGRKGVKPGKIDVDESSRNVSCRVIAAKRTLALDNAGGETVFRGKNENTLLRVS